MFKNSIKRALHKLGLGVYRLDGKYAEDGLTTVHSQSFRAAPGFAEAYARGIRASAGHDPRIEWRVHVALWAAQSSLRVPGDFVECGVNAGLMSSAIMQYLDWSRIDRRFFLVDTFAGPKLEQFSEDEVRADRSEIAMAAMNAGAYVTDFGKTLANFSEWPNAVVVRGAVPDVLPTISTETVAFLRIDMNCALPEQAAFGYFWEKLSPGAVVLFDDYAYLGHDYQRRAIDRMASQFGRLVLSLPTGQGLLIR